MASVLRLVFDPVGYRISKYKKAAKKRRVVKKWKNRFGPNFIERFLEEDKQLKEMARVAQKYQEPIELEVEV